MDSKIITIVVGATALLTQSVDQIASLIINDLQEGGSLVGTVPQLETIGQTVMFYTLLSRAITFLLAVPVIAFLGFKVGKQLNVEREYTMIARFFGIGGGAGILVGVLATGVMGNATFLLTQSLLGAVVLLSVAVATGIQFAFVGVAGAALAEFDAELSFSQQEGGISEEIIDSQSE